MQRYTNVIASYLFIKEINYVKILQTLLSHTGGTESNVIEHALYSPQPLYLWRFKKVYSSLYAPTTTKEKLRCCRTEKVVDDLRQFCWWNSISRIKNGSQWCNSVARVPISGAYSLLCRLRHCGCCILPLPSCAAQSYSRTFKITG